MQLESLVLRSIGSFLLAIGLPTLALAQANRPLEYTVTFDEAAAHYAQVQLMVPAQNAPSIELMMPTWMPGSYLVREYARHVDSISATDAAGNSLPVEKISKNRWRVDSGPNVDVSISYQLYCHEMSVRTNWIDQEMAIINGAATFLTPTTDRDKIHQIRFILPDHWSRSVTSLMPVEGLEHTYRAANLDELIDAPIICGNPVIEDFLANGVPHAVANLGDFDLWDTQKAAADVQKIVETQQKLWGNVPYTSYKFLNVSAESGGGLEHDNSTMVMTSRWNFRDQEKYENWLSLISHEFFHTWNVRRLRPANLAKYDYEQENMTRSLWVAEGITSYYEDLILVRAGLINRSAYFKRLSKQIEKLQTSPGRNVESLSDASFDAWIKFYRPDENSDNSRISYYTKGCVVAFLLDARIREVTNGTRSLDDLMRSLYATHANAAGFTSSDFALAATQVAGVDMSDWLKQHVETAQELDYQPALSWLGLQFGIANVTSNPSVKDEAPPANASPADESASTSQVASPKSGTPLSKRKAWLGAKLSTAEHTLSVSTIIHGSPAHDAGLNVGDELLGFNQYRISPSKWQDQLNQLGIGSTIDILVSRRGELKHIKLTTADEPNADWNLKPIESPSEEHALRVSQWLGDKAATTD